MTIATVDDIAAGLAVAQRQRMFKAVGAPKAAGAFQSGWRAAGFPGAASAPPVYTSGSGYTCDKSTTGAMPLTNAAAVNYLARLIAACSQPGTILIMDRLWQCSGMGFGISTYTVTTPGSLPARITDNGVGCQLWVENDVAAGAASGTLTATYVEPGGATAHTGVIAAVTSAPVAGQLQPVPLQAGDTGIKQLTSVANSATWTSGGWGMTITKSIAEIPILGVGLGEAQDWAKLGLPVIPADACVMIAFLAQNTTAPNIIANLSIIDK